MQQLNEIVQATCKFQARNVRTKNGERCNAVFVLPCGTEARIWSLADDPNLFSIRKGDTVQLVPHGNGYKLWLPDELDNVTLMPTRTAQKTVTSTPETSSRDRIEQYILSSSRLFRECHNATLAAMADTNISDSDAVAIALQLHQQTIQKFEL